MRKTNASKGIRSSHASTLGSIRQINAPAENQAVAQEAVASKVPTGVTRLDQLLGGGLPRGSSTLLYGGPFTGKGVMERLFFVQGIRHGEPGIFVLTDSDPYEMDLHLNRLEPGLKGPAQRGLVNYLDGYSRTVGAPDSHPHAHYLEGCSDLDVLLKSITDRIQQLQSQGHRAYRLVLQSVSTLLIEAGARAVFKFLRVLIGTVKRTGGSALFVVEAGMHPESEIEMIKYLAAGMVHTKELDDKFYLRVEGFRAAFRPGWVEYEFSPTDFHVVGSFASERIRSTVTT